ncbi:MAG: sigma-70 family RNA polymerase sigma factor [Verrucomicrobia bacterium]|nr:sigma-70 family RNA polymerase sigma factor [Verrucomicrobiota bacterium]
MSAVRPTRPSLLLRLRDADDHEAWRAFVQIYTPLIYGFCRKHGLQDADAADVAQEVMRTVARRIGEFEYQPDKGTFRAWLFTVTRSKLNNFFQTLQRQPQGTGRTTVHELLEAQPSPQPDTDWDHEYHQRLFEWACGQVHDEFEASTWQAFWQTAVEGKAGASVAASLGLSVGAVYVAKSRVLARLRGVTKEIDEDAGGNQAESVAASPAARAAEQ